MKISISILFPIILLLFTSLSLGQGPEPVDKAIADKLQWSEVSKDAQVAIELPRVDNPKDWKALSAVPITVYVRAVGDKPLKWAVETDFTNAKFYTADGLVRRIMLTPDPDINKNARTFPIKPGETFKTTARLSYDSVKKLHDWVSIGVELSYDDSPDAFSVISPLIDLSKINIFVETADLIWSDLDNGFQMATLTELDEASKRYWFRVFVKNNSKIPVHVVYPGYYNGLQFLTLKNGIRDLIDIGPAPGGGSNGWLGLLPGDEGSFIVNPYYRNIIKHIFNTDYPEIMSINIVSNIDRSGFRISSPPLDLEPFKTALPTSTNAASQYLPGNTTLNARVAGPAPHP